ncbi:MAG TPA: hypothetical protein VJ763_03255, partial [Sphingomicrobium sp.]|nr:hypothetical protein [Sphingomicrobium sp.]
MLYLYWRICYGKLPEPTPEELSAKKKEGHYRFAAEMPDLSMREWWLLGPIAACVFWMGLYPESFLRPMRADIGRLLERVERAAPPGEAHLTAGKPAPAAHEAAAH